MKPENIEILTRYMESVPKCKNKYVSTNLECSLFKKMDFPSECRRLDCEFLVDYPTFTTAGEAFAVKDQIEKNEEWVTFNFYAHTAWINKTPVLPNHEPFAYMAWVFKTPVHFMTMVAEWLKSRGGL